MGHSGGVGVCRGAGQSGDGVQGAAGDRIVWRTGTEPGGQG